MKENCLLHIVIPVYKQEDYFELCINSLVSSFHEWFETGLIKVTVLDDATPNTRILNIIQSHNNKHINYVKNKKNLGLFHNFQKCIDISEGKYLWIPGADDIILQFDVISFLRILNTAEFPFIAFGVSIINHLGEDYLPLQDIAKFLIRPKGYSLKRATFSSEQVLARLMIGNFFYFPSILWKTSEVRMHNFRDGFGTCLDLDLICRVLLKSEQILFLPNFRVLKYRRHDLSDSSQSAKFGQRYRLELAIGKEVLKAAISRKFYFIALLAWLSPTVRIHRFLSYFSFIHPRK